MNKLWYSEDQAGAKEKVEELSRVSNPKKVIENAQNYFNDPNVKIYLSTRKKSKYAIYDPINKKLVHFGHLDYQDFTKHQDQARRENYLRRATNIRGNWRNNPYSPNNLSVNLLWQ